jgi:hypothetical protein
MSKIDTSLYKPRILEYIQKKGISIVQESGYNKIHCPKHNDEHPSAIIYDDNLYCPVCSESWDVFECAGFFSQSKTFPERKEEVLKTLGEALPENTVKKSAPKTKKKKTAVPVPVSIEKARELFTTKKMLSMSSFKGSGDPKKGYGENVIAMWPYLNKDGLVEIIDVRFEGGPKNKNVVSFYYDGKNVKSAGAPVCIYNRDLIEQYSDYLVLIVEGCKTAKAATEALLEYKIIPVTWNGGTGKILMPDWSCIKDRKKAFLPDDDKPGIKAAVQFQKEYTDCKIIQPVEKAREIKPKGADIVEILQIMTPDKLAEYIHNSENYNPGAPDDDHSLRNVPPQDSNHSGSFDGAPFRLLGIGENGKAYFMDPEGRVQDTRLTSLSKTFLSAIAPIQYWMSYQGTSRLSNADWDEIKSDIIHITNKIDFSTNNIRGRGAWKDSDGKICFHDGKDTYGEYKDNLVFLRKDKIDIGINSKPLDQETIDKMKKVCFEMSFETKSDAMRLLSWSILAPFSGALEWRPQAFLTGPSSSGKSSIENFIVKKLSISDRYNGGKTSAAGYMQSRKSDTGAVTIEEADPDTEKKRIYKEDLLSIMRQSTSDDTPKSAMGTSDQSGTVYTTRDMFLFVAISPEIESVADDNRLVRINIVKPSGKGRKWHEIKADLISSFTADNCKRLRGMLWDNIKNLAVVSDRISTIIQDHTGKDHRFAISEGTLMAAYLIIWKGIKNPDDKTIQEFVTKNYDMKKPEDDRDDTGEIIEKLMQHTVKVYGDKVKEYSVRECLMILKSNRIFTGKDTDFGGYAELTDKQANDFKRAVNNIGISLDPDDNLAIANSHKEIKRITGRSNGYSRVLKRHESCIENNKNIHFLDGQRKCTVLENIISYESDEDLPF